MQICGVDDAGRGSVIGPLLVAGVSIEKTKVQLLKEMGIKDSKRLSPSTREKIYKKIIRTVDSYHIVKVSPKRVDASVNKNLLNDLEARSMARVISKLSPSVSYVDSCDVNPNRFGRRVFEFAQTSKIISSHRADEEYTIVSAASIVAKVSRDRTIKKLNVFHSLGSGYPSDTTTMNFVRSCFEPEEFRLPPFIRKTWKPVRLLMGQKYNDNGKRRYGYQEPLKRARISV